MPDRKEKRTVMAKYLIAVQDTAVNVFLNSFIAYSKKRQRDDEYETVSNPVEISSKLDSDKYDGMLVQYQIGAVPFEVNDIVRFRDTNEQMRIVIIVPANAKGGTFLNNLLSENILGAIYEDEAKVSAVMKLLNERRTRAGAKAYYGITDSVVTKEAVNSIPKHAISSAEKVAQLRSYIVDGNDRPFDERFEHVAGLISYQEIQELIKTLDAPTIDEMRRYPKFRAYLPAEPVKEERKGLFGGLFGGGKKKNASSPAEPQEKEDAAPSEPAPKPVKTEPEQEKKPAKHEEKEEKKEPVKPSPAKVEEKSNVGGEQADGFFESFFEPSFGNDTPAEPSKEVPKQEKKPEPITEVKSKPVEQQNNNNKKENTQNNNRSEHGTERKPDNRNNVPLEKKQPPQNTEKAKADADREKRLKEEQIRRDERLREEARKEAEEKAERDRTEAAKREAELKAKNEQLAKEANEKLAQETKALAEKAEAEKKALLDQADADKKNLEEQKAAELKAKDDEIKKAKAEADRKAKEDAAKLAAAEQEKARLEKEKEQQAKAQQKREEEYKAQLEKVKSDANMTVKEELAKMQAEFQAQIDEIKKASNAQIEDMKKASDARMREAEKKEKEAEKRVQKAESNIKTVTVKQMISRRVVGVFSLVKGYDAVPVALQLAKTLSMYEPVTYIEVPRESEGIYTRLNFAKLIGPTFKSVPHMVQNGEADFSTVRNMYAGINYFAANDAYGEVAYSYNNVSRMVDGTSDNIVLEAGRSLEEARKDGLLNLCTKAVIVLDHDEEEMYIPRIKDEVAALDDAGIEAYVLSVSEKGNEISSLSADIYYSAVKRSRADAVTELAIRNSETSKFLGYFGLNGAVKQKLKKQNVKIKIMGTRDIAVFGAERGNGVTHTCLMMADSVRKDYRTAIIELNKSGHMEALAKELGQFDNTGRMNLYGIDVFYNMTWQQFSASYRSDYQVVIIDFGTYPNAYNKQRDGSNNRPVCNQCAKRYLVFDASPWRLSVLDKMVPLMDGDSDPNGQIELLAPMTTPAGLKQYRLYDRVGHREIHCMPDCEMPVKCDDKTAEFMRELVLK